MDSSIRGRVRSVRIVALAICMSVSIGIYSQSGGEDLNLYYRFPVSVGAEYQNLTPLSGLNEEYSIMDLGAEIRFPLQNSPAIQPLFRGGAITLDSLNTQEPDKWDHYHLYGLGGFAYVNRFSKNFEVGGYLSTGITQSVFPNVVEEGPVGGLNVMTVAGGKIDLIPSYNLAIELHPSLRYMHSLSELDIFDGLYYGLGLSVHFRLGTDPDSAGSLIRSIRFVNAEIPPLFSAMQSYYTQNPMGQVTIQNTERTPLEDVQVLFYQKDFMDSETLADEFPSIAAGESVTVPLFASFNSSVFTTEGVTPMSGEVVVRYSLRGRPAEQRYPVRYDLHDKTAISWDDDRKVGAFITPADSALRNYGSFIRQAVKEEALDRFNSELQTAMQTYAALEELGTIYQVDPASPFTQAQENPVFVDSVSLPRDTLKRITGDCDDLTVLYCSILESMGIETGFITVPGHIYPVVNTGLESRRYASIHPNRNMTIVIDGQIWVPVEITLLGSFNFLDAWRKGADLWNSYNDDPERRGFYRTRESQQIYRPVGLRETDLGLQYGTSDNVVKGYTEEMNRLASIILESYENRARRNGRMGDYNRLGLAYSIFERYGEAERAFRTALRMNPDYLNALVNLGNLAYLRENHSLALENYSRAEQLVSRRGGNDRALQKILLNISQVHRVLDDIEASQTYYAKAAEVDPESIRAYAFLGDPSSGANQRAGNLGETGILFLEEEPEEE